MSGWKYISIVILVLVGGTAVFGYYSLNQLNQTLDNVSNSHLANTYSIYQSFKQNQNTKLASTSLEISGELATSTDETLATTTSATIVATTTPIIATSTALRFSFTFPQKDSKIYVGCTYPISWQSSTMINSLETALVDASIREPIGSTVSGLTKENTIKKDVQNLKWKVGAVQQGAYYYIKVSKINDIEAVVRSKVFEIHKMPATISTDEKGDICKKSGGFL